MVRGRWIGHARPDQDWGSEPGGTRDIYAVSGVILDGAHIGTHDAFCRGMRLRSALAALGIGLLGAACAATSEDEAAQDDSAMIDTNAPPMTKARVAQVAAPLVSLDQLPAALPKELLINFTLKHGRLYTGENGHLIEQVVSQSSSPTAPRAILWDERSGLTLSYNGGVSGQTEPNRLDVLEFNDTTKKFEFSALQFDNTHAPVWQTEADMPEASRKCSHCHGAETRPIFAMYPDWPSFYGSDNDELTDTSKAVEARESTDYKQFRSDVSTKHLPRYAPLYDAANVKAHLRGIDIYPSYPYRQDTNEQIEAVSRAFAFRPALRFGILMNRQMAASAAERIESHPNFDRFGALFLHELLQCRSSATAPAWSETVKNAIGRAPKTAAGGKTFNYRDMLALFGMEVRDLDIRYSYNHAGYANEDASNKVMEVGYIDGSYWNSYFDGSATIDELLAMKLYEHLTADPDFADLKGLVPNPDGLVVKYERRAERFKFDKNFFTEMDAKGRWIPIPYPEAKLNDVHHREGYPTRFQTQHAALCGKLEGHLKTTSTAPSSSGSTSAEATSCPASCVASTYCKDHPNAAHAIKVNGLPCMVSGAAGCQACTP